MIDKFNDYTKGFVCTLNLDKIKSEMRSDVIETEHDLSAIIVTDAITIEYYHEHDNILIRGTLDAIYIKYLDDPITFEKSTVYRNAYDVKLNKQRDGQIYSEEDTKVLIDNGYLVKSSKL